MTVITPIGAIFLALCLILVELRQILCANISHFRYHGNRGRSVINFNVTVLLLDLENNLFGAIYFAPYLIYYLTSSQSCVKIPNFSLPW